MKTLKSVGLGALFFLCLRLRWQQHRVTSVLVSMMQGSGQLY